MLLNTARKPRDGTIDSKFRVLEDCTYAHAAMVAVVGEHADDQRNSKLT